MAGRARKFWLMKSEPDVFSLEDLERCENRTEPWDGIRNYQARNFMRDEMRPGDGVLFYHSNCKVPGVVGLAEIASTARPDPTALDPDSNYYDPQSDPDNPRWLLVDVKWVRAFPRTVSLQAMKAERALAQMRALQRGNRLSITPVSKSEFGHICAMAQR